MRLNKSKKLYERSQEVLAGPSTFGKGVDQFAYGITPYALNRGKGAFTWDVDGNEYIDMVMGCGPVTLGHNHPVINDAIKRQMDDGILYSMLHPLEVEVAEKLIKSGKRSSLISGILPEIILML